ncbi:MAG TPA: DNA starvation/stationary phase protection protein Dps [Planctomycetota bacterium]|nr:DNA starvation/stationary phase protection protein Dps [Planctomycetota bacterium]
MHPTKNDLPERTRTGVVDLLAPHVASAIDLMLQAKHAHWNVKGPNFIALHELFDKVAATAQKHADGLAERIAQLGGRPSGLVKQVAAHSKLPSMREDLVLGRDHVEAVASALAAFGAGVRRDIDKATELGDADTADLLTEVSRETDENLWFVEAHNQAEA